MKGQRLIVVVMSPLSRKKRRCHEGRREGDGNTNEEDDEATSRTAAAKGTMMRHFPPASESERLPFFPPFFRGWVSHKSAHWVMSCIKNPHVVHLYSFHPT